MKLSLNESMQLTKSQKKGGIILPFIAAFIIPMIQGIVVVSLGFSGNLNNPRMIDDLMGLFLTIISILLVILYSKFIEKRSIPSLGITKKSFSKNYAIGLIIGLLMIFATFGINFVLGGISFSLNSESINWIFIILALFGFLIQGFSEELICRGFLMNSVTARKGPIVGIISNSLFFAALHLLNPGITVLSFINIVLFGIATSLIFYKTNNLWIVGAIHSIWNFFQGPIFGVQVSGTSNFSTVFQTIPVQGKNLFNGGAFGFEGGLVVTLILIITIIISYALINKKTESEGISRSI